MKEKRSMKKLFSFICLIVMISLLVFGCASETTQTQTSDGPRKGGTLKVAINKNPVNIGNPATNNMSPADMFISSPAIESLLRVNEHGEPVPWLATEWKIDSNAKTITFKLRQGVKFHDGTDFNAQAVKWNLDEYKAKGMGELAKVTSVDVVDNYTVRFNLSQMDALIIPNMATTIPGLIVSPKAVQERGAEWAAKNPVGTGPYQFEGWERDVRIGYKKFDGYWQKGQPYLDGIEFKIIVDAMTQVAAIQQGDVDLISDLDPKNAHDLEASKKFLVSKTSLPGKFPNFAPDSLNPEAPLSKLKVRQAFLHAIDMEAISKQLGYGYWEALNQPATKGSWAYNPSVKGYPYNPEKAKQLLAEAGYPNGFQIKLNSLMYSPYSELMPALQGYLKEVGIDAKLELLDSAAHKNAYKTASYVKGAILMPGTIIPNELGSHARYFRPEVAKKVYPLTDIPVDLQNLVAKASEEAEFEKMKASVQQLNKVMVDDYAMMLWLFAMPGLAAKSPQVTDDGICITTQYQWTPEKVWKK